MESTPILRFIIAGRLQRNFLILPSGKAITDITGGGALYAATGLGVWEGDIGLIGRVGEDYPQEWLAEIRRRGLSTRGVRVLPAALDVRWFATYPDPDTCYTDSPVTHYARLGLPYPKPLLGYQPESSPLDSRTQPTAHTLRTGDFPADYLDASAAHICPLDYISHSLLPAALRQGRISTITLDPSAGYMNPTFWDDVPSIVKGLTAFLTSEEKLNALFQGRSNDLWEMAETIAGYGCELVVIKRRARGQYLYEAASKTRWMLPAYPARVSDPTGGGDSFCGGFLAGYRRTYSPLEALLYGSVSASLAVEGSGPFYALDALPGLAQARLEALRGMARKA